MEYAFLVLGILALGAAIYGVVGFYRGYKADSPIKTLSKKQWIWLGITVGVFGLSALFLQLSIDSFCRWNMDGGHVAMAVIGAFLFGVFFSALWLGFSLYFYRPNTEKKHRRIFEIAMYSAIPLSLFSFLLLGEGVAPYLSYPLACGFAINSSGWHWLTAANVGSAAVSGGFSIRWYGIIIVFGALCCYWISDHKFYQKYGKHGILETLLLVCFPGGIIGARIWYVVGNWEREGFAQDFSKVFRIWDGGLTILGGAVGGILAGVAFMLIRRKWVDIRYAMDVIVPTILIGQAVGRWGNFFNNEVYGQVVSLNSGWQWLPTWIAKQMNYAGATQTFLPAGQINVPLFLVESLLNIFGYYLIAYIIPALWKKQRGLGVLSGLYLVWYGVVRIIMEPMRNANYNMGTDGQWSFWNAMIYIILGVVLTAVFETMWIVQKGKSWSRGSLENLQEKEAVAVHAPVEKKKKPTKQDVESAPTISIPEKPKKEEHKE